MSAAMTEYRAKADCRAGGCFRRKGEVFTLPAFEDGECPGHLEPVDGDAAKGGKPAVKKEADAKKGPAKGGKPAPVPASAQVTPADIGAGKPTPAADVTSVDMVAK